MGRINLLDEEISNKIAAGEVVERPASVVKELVENSIDAGATKIIVEIKKGGSTYIRVTDNGSGMDKEDAAVSFLRHATSKIKIQEDLNAIYTLGFRGEALSSIGAVSMVDLYTKRQEDLTGTHTTCQGGEIISAEDAGVPDGTSFIVKNLFYNVPARMKFLKKDATEAGYINDIMTRFILAHPEISFVLISNSKEVLHSTGDGQLKNAIYAVYGKDFATSMIEVDFKSEHISVSGMTGKGNTARPNRSCQSFFINGRYIKSPLIMRAVEEAYKNQIMIGKFPVSVLDIKVNPSFVDINVHPTKLEVKFSNESEVYSVVYNAVKEALYRICDIPKIVKEGKKPVEIPMTAVQKPIEKPIEKIIDKLAEKPTEKAIEKQKIYAVSAPPIIKRDISVLDAALREMQKDADKLKVEQPKEEQAKVQEIIKEEITEYKLIGQIFNTYIIIETGDEMRLIDQHAAHERLKYEELKKQLENKQIYSQSLIIPSVVNLTAKEMAVYKENTEFIASMGFDAEEFDNNSVIIRAIPIDSLFDDIEDLFIEIISQLEDCKKEIITKKHERLLYTIACKAAIKANSKMSEQEQKNLVDTVLLMDNINTCPHGRPIIISMSKKEVEKSFKRIV